MKKFFLATVGGLLTGVLVIAGMHLYMTLCQRQFRSWGSQPPPMTLPLRVEIHISNFIARYEILLALPVLVTCLVAAYVLAAYKKTN